MALEQLMLMCSLLSRASYMHGKGKMLLCHHAKRGASIRGPFWLKRIADPSLKCRAGCFRLVGWRWLLVGKWGGSGGSADSSDGMRETPGGLGVPRFRCRWPSEGLWNE